MVFGTEGALLIPHQKMPHLLPKAKFASRKFDKLPFRNHYHDFADGCLGVSENASPFPKTGPMAETIILGTVYLSLVGLVDKAAEAKRIAGELAKLAGFIKAGEAKLANTQFTEHAPAQIVETARRQLADNKAKVAQLEKLARLFA